MAPLCLMIYDKASLPFAGFPDFLYVFQWYGDTFELSREAVFLAMGKIYQNQAFLHRGRTLAIQFHPEVTPGMIASWTKAHPKGLLEFGNHGIPIQFEKETQGQ